jgi:SAM-dependent methyltransferase
MSAEFDNYARDYQDLLKDPIRDRFAQDGAFFHARKWDLLKQSLSSRFGDLQKLRWLDIGCGKGELLRFGRPSVAEAIGCDPSKEMIAECADLNVVWQSAIAKLPFDSGTFDVVTAACVYHHLDADAQAGLTAEAFRLLRPNGVFVIFEHNPWNPATRLIVSRTPIDANAVLLTASKTRSLMKRAGMKSCETTYYLYFPEPVYRRIGGVEKILRWLPGGGQYAVMGSR